MAVNVEHFLKQKYQEFQISEVLKTEELYDDISNIDLKNLLAILHQEFNRLFKYMFSKGNNHFNAIESRQLLAYIKLYEDLQYVLKDTGLSFKINDDYQNFIQQCKDFLKESGGSTIPTDLKRIRLIDYEPIFIMQRTVKVSTNESARRYPIKLIGKGSYASVFKYKDEFYDKNFIIKRANDELDEKELERFKKEFLTMKELKSPYVLDVYRYDDINKEYYAEYADETLCDFIDKNNSKLTIEQRKNIAYQVFKAFSYIHSKGYLHRDISLSNVLLITYDDVIVVKISDFGLVKEENSTLTSVDSEVKGSLNDSNLSIVGFSKYSIEYETYALTRLILFIMTGKRNLEKVDNPKIKDFVLKGINPDISKRFKSVEEMKEYFKNTF